MVYKKTVLHKNYRLKEIRDTQNKFSKFSQKDAADYSGKSFYEIFVMLVFLWIDKLKS